MKKVLLILLLLVFYINSSAQKHQWEFGAEAGPNCNYLLSLIEPAQNHGPNYMFAGTVEYKFDSIFSIKSGLSFTRISFNDFIVSEAPVVPDQPINNYSSPVGIELNYLVIPILAKFEWGDNAKFFVNGGPYFACLTEAHNVIQIQDGNGGSHYYYSQISNFKPYDIGASAGFGFDIPLSKKLILDWGLRFNFGLTKITYPPDNNVYTSQSANLLLGLRYAIIK